jgi:WD40 repeat protein
LIITTRSPAQVLVGSRWTSHTSRVNSLSWNPDGIRIVSGGLDESIYIWNAQKTLKKEAVKVSPSVSKNSIAKMVLFSST